MMYKLPVKRVTHSNQLPKIADLMNEHVPYMEHGTFLEAGAFDGVSWSMTYWLLELGWRGICIEPHPEHFKSLQENLSRFKNATFCNVALGPHTGSALLYKNGSLTTTSEAMIRLYHDEPWAATPLSVLDDAISVPMQTLEYVCVNNNVSEIDLLVLDTEGTELDILLATDITALGVKMAVIELHETLESLPLRFQVEGVTEYMTGHGMEKVYADYINTVFVRRQENIVQERTP